jgi:drug/metabolite transporter (DMT)-like permease
MSLPWHFILPLLAALAYVTAAMFIKRASDLGAGVWRAAFVMNVLSALCFQPLRLLGGHESPLAHWWQPALVALLFFAGQIFTFVSLSRGDVSVATPVLGLKIILVAALATALFAQPISPQLWLAALLATAGVALLNRSGAASDKGNVTHTLITAGLAAVSFALFDVLVQKWSPLWGMGRFLPATIGLVGLYSFALIPLFEAPLRALPRPA